MLEQDFIDKILNDTNPNNCQDENLNIGDIVEAIQTTDPVTAQVMFDPHNVPPSNGEILSPTRSVPRTSRRGDHSNKYKNAYVVITEQPASKALRFRYECEGRCAGSIPGVNSSPENKTFPSIQVIGFKGKAFVKVSCVTKDKPYRAHPHNLVGKEGCDKGICTVEINSNTMSVSFSSLGIQCVKKRDIAEALRIREEIKVDPYGNGFSHQAQPSSLDLNSVRLCFQVFLKSDQFAVPLKPVVSDPIFDKKAMSDLVICKLSDASCTVAGGKEMILLCEKVAKEDIAVRFFEERNGLLYWEHYGEFSHNDVHKQVAIYFRTPKYKTLEVEHTIKCFIQLKRPSDGVTSEPLPFEYLPLDSGRRSIWSMRKNLKNKTNFELFNRILSEDKICYDMNGQSDDSHFKECNNKRLENIVIDLDTPTEDQNQQIGDDPVNQLPLNKQQMDIVEVNSDKTTEWIRNTEFNTDKDTNGSAVLKTENCIDDDKALNELLDQVAELDEIYIDHQLIKENSNVENEINGLDNIFPKSNDPNGMDLDDLFDDTATYTSLQIAFKNPVPIIDLLPPSPPVNAMDCQNSTHYDSAEPLLIINPQAPIIDISSLKRESPKVDDEKLPPLPPKRVKKGFQNVENNENQPVLNRDGYNSNQQSPLKRPQSQIIIMKTPDQSPINKKLPSTSNSQNNNCNSTLSKQKKPGFFSKLFSRKKSKSDNHSNISPSVKCGSVDTSREPSLKHFDPNDPNRMSTRSIKSLQIPGGKKSMCGKPVGRSVSSVSGKRPQITADVIHIPLKGDSEGCLPLRSGSGTLLSIPDERFNDRSNTATFSNNLDRKTVSALQLADLPLQEGNMELIAIADRQSLRNLCQGEFGVELDPNIDLTEAEHYALYTSVAPYATESEFDETSCYYAPVETSELLTQNEVATRLANSMNHLH